MENRRFGDVGRVSRSQLSLSVCPGRLIGSLREGSAATGQERHPHEAKGVSCAATEATVNKLLHIATEIVTRGLWIIVGGLRRHAPPAQVAAITTLVHDNVRLVIE